ncbi:MAG: hypothetical protein ACOY3K_05105 [Candidatus Omnitrophota bacterium]
MDFAVLRTGLFQDLLRQASGLDDLIPERGLGKPRAMSGKKMGPGDEALGLKIENEGHAVPRIGPCQPLGQILMAVSAPAVLDPRDKRHLDPPFDKTKEGDRLPANAPRFCIFRTKKHLPETEGPPVRKKLDRPGIKRWGGQRVALS